MRPGRDGVNGRWRFSPRLVADGSPKWPRRHRTAPAGLSAGAGVGGHERGGAPDRRPEEVQLHDRAATSPECDRAVSCQFRPWPATASGRARPRQFSWGEYIEQAASRIGRSVSPGENPEQIWAFRRLRGDSKLPFRSHVLARRESGQPGREWARLVRRWPAPSGRGSGTRRRDQPPRRSAAVPSRRRSSGRRARRGPGTSG